MNKIRTAVVGAGKIGAIHARVYDQLPQSDFVAVVDIDRDKAERLANQYGCCAFTDCSDILDRVDPVKSSWVRGTGGSSLKTFNGVDAVTIATPTVTHLELAKIFIENNVAVMVEKPLAANTKEGRKIVKLAKKSGSVVAVGHSERCNPVVQAMKRLNIEPKFIEVGRVSPYPFRSTDVGVVLDVMIHDIDIVLSLVRSPIKKVYAVGVSIGAPFSDKLQSGDPAEEKEDICNARIVFENGCIANITASRLALKTERRLRLFSRQAYLSVDYLNKDGIVIKAAPNINVVKWIKEHKGHSAELSRNPSGDFDLTKVNWPDLLHIERLHVDDKDPLCLEQEAFLRACADGRHRPEVSAEEGLAAIECAEKILASVRKHKWD